MKNNIVVCPKSLEGEICKVVFEGWLDMRKCGEKWADVLGLSDWTISYVLSDKESEGLELGHNDYDFETKTSVITIYKMPANEHFKIPQEETLIHELLHCKYPIDYDSDNYESVRCAQLQHQVLNDIGRALFMAKYDMTLDKYKSETKKKKRQQSKQTGRAIIADSTLAKMF